MDALRDEIERASSEHDRLLAEDHAWLADLAQKSNGRGIVDGTGENNAPAPAPVPAPGAFFGDHRDDLLARNLGIIVAEVSQELRREWKRDIDRCLTHVGKIARGAASDRREFRWLVSLLQDEIKTIRKRLDLDGDSNVVSKLQIEVDQLRGRIQECVIEKRERTARDQIVVERSARISELQRENAIARREAERADLDRALAEYRSRIDMLETKLAMLLAYFGGDLPKGFGA